MRLVAGAVFLGIVSAAIGLRADPPPTPPTAEELGERPVTERISAPSRVGKPVWRSAEEPAAPMRRPMPPLPPQAR